LFGLGISIVTAAVAYRFIAAITIAVFIYYSTRPLYRFLGRLYLPYPKVRVGKLYIPRVSIGKRRFLPKRIRAVLVILFLAVPLITLIGYTVVLLLGETRAFIQEYPVSDTITENVGVFEGLGELPDLTIDGLVQGYQDGQFDELIDFARKNANIFVSAISGFFLNLLIIIIVTYYLLIDGWQAREWLLKFDEDAIVRDYLEVADKELEAVLFGNLLNVIAISIVAIVVFMGYNFAVPGAAEVPYPALAGVLTGIASLVPVVGMKLIYVPLALAVAVPAVITSQLTLLLYVGVFIALSLVVVDTVPDLVLRPYLSGDETHIGLLMLAYILGPILFGFHGLFLAPIILVLGLTFATTALPRLLGAKEDDRDGGVQLEDITPTVPKQRPEELPQKQRNLNDYSEYGE